ncbi:hypothetical protein [Massilia sp. 9096]|uniref:hypothetical protein n=1 Tax=Massilia sp. 9096 TaxID=1500894 RepID=UPI0012DFF9D5|nr:hypothetical protein [Massilia sp. 9096]
MNADPSLLTATFLKWRSDFTDLVAADHQKKQKSALPLRRGDADASTYGENVLFAVKSKTIQFPKK